MLRDRVNQLSKKKPGPMRRTSSLSRGSMRRPVSLSRGPMRKLLAGLSPAFWLFLVVYVSLHAFIFFSIYIYY
jgi:hypothetical protein